MTATRRRPIDVALPPEGVFVLESHHGPGFRMKPERHDFLELFYVLHGRGAFHIDGGEYPCRRGDLVAVPVGLLHHIEDDPDEPLSLYGVCVAPRVWEAEPDVVARLPAGRQPVGRSLASRVRGILRRLLFEQTSPQPGGRALAVGLTLQLLARLARESADDQPLPAPVLDSRVAIERYLAELPQRFFEATDLDTAAAELGVSRRRFTQLFRQVAGESWGDVVTRLRIDYAGQLLRETNRSAAATAFECGYEDVSSFYRAFKRLKGVPPRAWRDGAG
ncbi:MAG: AraC family transcriptional regulator [Gemmataceae bacterium]